MTITLMRHGKPHHPPSGRRSAQAMMQWCDAYDLAEICDLPPDRSLRLAGEADIIVTSPLPRARSSFPPAKKPGLAGRKTCQQPLLEQCCLPPNSFDWTAGRQTLIRSI